MLREANALLPSNLTFFHPSLEFFSYHTINNLSSLKWVFFTKIQIPLILNFKNIILLIINLNLRVEPTVTLISSKKNMKIKKISQIVFIDSKVDDREILLSHVNTNARVFVINPDEDGVYQITTALKQYQEVSEIHIVSHGSPGCLYLGNSELSLATLEKYSSQLKQWQGNLFLYGCNVAAGDAGEEFVEKMHKLTKANIAASTQRFGNVAKGGSWELDYCLGEIKPEIVFSSRVQAVYTGILSDLDVRSLSNSSFNFVSQGALLATNNVFDFSDSSEATPGVPGTIEITSATDNFFDIFSSGTDSVKGASAEILDVAFDFAIEPEVTYYVSVPGWLTNFKDATGNPIPLEFYLNEFSITYNNFDNGVNAFSLNLGGYLINQEDNNFVPVEFTTITGQFLPFPQPEDLPFVELPEGVVINDIPDISQIQPNLITSFSGTFMTDKLIPEVSIKHGTAGDDLMKGGYFNDGELEYYWGALYGYAGNDTLYGAEENDELRGHEENDVLNGRGGDDQMYGGFGDDLYIVNELGDEVIEVVGAGTDKVLSKVNYILPDDVEKLILKGTANLNGNGNNLDNVIRGNSGNNLLFGSMGNDTLKGMAGNDILLGGLGNDKLTGGSGADEFRFTALSQGVDTITDFKPGTDVISILASAFKIPVSGNPEDYFTYNGKALFFEDTKLAVFANPPANFDVATDIDIF